MSGSLVIIGGGESECTACQKEDKDGVALECDGAEIFLCWMCLKKTVRIRRASSAAEKKTVAAGL